MLICCNLDDSLPRPDGFEPDDYLGRALFELVLEQEQEDREEREREEFEADLLDRLLGRCDCCGELASPGRLVVSGELALCDACLGHGQHGDDAKVLLTVDADEDDMLARIDLACMPPTMAQALALAIDGRSARDAALELGIPLNTYRSRLGRARAWLRAAAHLHSTEP